MMDQKTFDKRCQERIPNEVPEQVREVAVALMRNCLEAAEESIKEYGEVGEEAEGTINFWMNRTYIVFEPERGGRMRQNPCCPTSSTKIGGEPAWVVCDNYDRAPSLIFYPERTQNQWVYYESYGDSERPSSHGRAIANASIMYTG